MADIRVTISVLDKLTPQFKRIQDRLTKFRRSVDQTFNKKLNLQAFSLLEEDSGTITETRERLEALSKTYKDLLSEFSRGNVTLTAEAFRDLNKAIKRVDTRLARLNRLQQTSTRRLRIQQKVVKTLKAGLVKLSVAGFKRLNFNVAQAINNTRRLTSNLTALFTPVKRLAQIGSIGLFASLGFITKTTADFERFQLQIQAVNRDVIRTSQEFSALRKEAALSPLTTGEFVESFQRLRTLGVAEVKKTNTVLAQVAAVFGRDLTDVTSAFISLEARTLRRLGVIVTRTTNKAIVRSGNLIKVVNNNVDEIRKGIRDVFEKRFPDAFRFLENSLSAQFNVVKSLVQDIAFDIGNAAVRKPLLALLTKTKEFLEKNRTNIVAFFDIVINDSARFIDLLTKTFNSGLDRLGGGGTADTIFAKLTSKVVGIFVNATKVFFKAFSLVAVNLANVIITSFEIGGDRLINSVKKAFNDLKGIDGVKIAELNQELIKSQQAAEGFKGQIDKAFNPDTIRSLTLRLAELNGRIQFLKAKIKEEGGLFGAEGILNAEELQAQTTKTLGALATRIKNTNSVIFEGLKTDLNNLANDSVNGVKQALALADNLFLDSLKKGFNELKEDSVIRRATEQLEELQRVGAKNLIRPLNVALITKAIPLIEKRIEALNKIADDVRLDDKIAKIGGELDALQNAQNQGRGNFSEQIKVLRVELERLLSAGDKATALEKILELVDASKLLDKAKPILIDYRKLAAQALNGNDIFQGKSLGTQLLDDNILIEKSFKDRLKEFIATQKDFESIIGDATGIKRAFQRLVSTNAEFARDTVSKLLDGAFKNIQLPTAELQSLERATGSISKVLREVARESLGSEKAVQSFFNQLKRGGGDAKLAKELLRTDRVINILTTNLIKAKSRVANFGKELNLLDSNSGKISEAYLKFARSISNVNKTDLFGLNTTQAFSPKAFLEALKNSKQTVEKFLNSDDFIEFRPDFIDTALDGLNIPESLQAKFTEFQKKFKGNQLVSNIAGIGKQFKAETGEVTLALNELVSKNDTGIQKINASYASLSDESKLALDTFTRALQGAGITAAAAQAKIDSLIQADTGNLFLGLQEGINTLNKSLFNFRQAGADAVAGVADSLTNNLSTAFVSIIDGSKTAKEAFKDFASSLLADITQMVVKFVVLQGVLLGINALLGFFTGGASFAATGAAAGVQGAAGGALGGLGNLFSFAKGGIMQGTRLSKRAKGGVATGPELALFGEGRNAEAFVPLPDNRRIPVELKGNGKESGGSTQVNLNLSYQVNAIDAQGTAKFLRDNQRSIATIMVQELNSSRALRASMPIRR